MDNILVDCVILKPWNIWQNFLKAFHLIFAVSGVRNQEAEGMCFQWKAWRAKQTEAIDENSMHESLR